MISKNNFRSRNLYNRAQAVMPGGVCHNIRYHPPYPIYVHSAEGSHFSDADGNSYIDYWMGHYTNILGHSPPVVVKAVKEALENKWTHTGIVNPWEVELAEAVVRYIPSAEKVRFCCSGSEATMYAVRLARAFTDRDWILKIEGGWHGAHNDLMVGVAWPYDIPDSRGLPPGIPTDCIPFNDAERARDAIRKRGKSLAAVIVEPILGVGGFIAADTEFLKTLREETLNTGAILIYDEIISGFRVGMGGAQEFFGILPDLTVLGKILGGGMPVGGVAGRADILQLADPTRFQSKGDRTLIGGGTFSCHPLTMASGLAMLNSLNEQQESIYPELARKGDKLRAGIEKAFASQGVYACCTGFGSLFMTHFPLQENLTIKNAADANDRTDVRQREIELKQSLIESGVFVMHGGGAISTAHTEEDLEKTCQAMEEAASRM